MREKLSALIERLFPGMGARAFLLTILATLCMIGYWHLSGRHEVPGWFFRLSLSIWRVDSSQFHEHAWSHVLAAAILLGAPLFFCHFDGMGPRELGLSIRQAKRELGLVLVLWLAFLPVIWAASTTDSFARMYPRLPAVKDNVHLFIRYEGFYLVKWIAWEFFFRGFMLFAFAKDLGSKSVLVSTIPFVLMHFGKPQAEVYGSVAAGFILGWLAWRSRSIWPGVILHWLVATSMDFFASRWWR